MSLESSQTGQLGQTKGPAEDEARESALPPRKAVHRTERDKWLRYFYRSLLWLFILLVVGLLIWGWRRVRGEL